MLRRSRAELVLYDAGVDVYERDKLGWLRLSHAGIWQRDLAVVDACVAAGVPVATVIGGGYDDDPLALARRHALVVRASAHVWRKRGLGRGLGTPGGTRGAAAAAVGRGGAAAASASASPSGGGSGGGGPAARPAAGVS